MNGNNDDDGDGYITPELCDSHRELLEIKILNMESKIRWSVWLTGAVITIVLTAVNWYLSVVR